MQRNPTEYDRLLLAGLVGWAVEPPEQALGESLSAVGSPER